MLAILSAIFLWSSLGIIIRISGISILMLIFSSCLVSVFIISPMFLRQRYREIIPKLGELPYLTLIGLVSLVNTFSFYYAYRNTTIANAVLTHYTAPVLVALLAPVFLKERLTARIVGALVLATCGLWILLDVSFAQFRELILAGDANTRGIIGGLFSGVAYALLVIILKISSRTVHPLFMTLWQNLVIVAVLLPFVRVPDDLRSLFLACAVMGIVHSTVAPVLYFKGLQRVTANKAAILGYLEPVSAILLGALFLGETITSRNILGGTLILLSGYITARDSGEASLGA